MQADLKVKLARDLMPVVQECVYLDTGSVGPVSTVYAETLMRCTHEDERTGRARDFRWQRMSQARERIRDEIAQLLNVDAAQLELTRGTTDAVQALIGRYPWEAGDEIVSTPLEYPACGDALSALADARGLRLRVADVPNESAEDLAWLERCLTPGTKLIAFTGVAYATGQKLPAREIAELARARGIRTLVDGAQLVGASPFDLDATRVDFLAMPLQKWLCGPEGLGALYVRDGQPDLLRPDGAIHGWPVLEATAVHLAWLRESLGWRWIHERTRELSRYARQALESFESDRLLTPNSHAGLIAMSCDAGTSAAVARRLEAGGLVVRYRPELGLFRISTAFFNTESDIRRFVELMRQ